MQMQVFLFSLFNVMNTEKKLSALNQQFKYFYFQEMMNTNNNFSFEGKMRFSTTISPIKEMKILRQFPILKANDY